VDKGEELCSAGVAQIKGQTLMKTLRTFFAVTIGMIFMLALASVGQAATVTTDRLDYRHTAMSTSTGPGGLRRGGHRPHRPLEPRRVADLRVGRRPAPTADANGAFTVLWYIYSDEFIGDTLQVTAAGLNAAGAQETATTIFTDTGPAPRRSIRPQAASTSKATSKRTPHRQHRRLGSRARRNGWERADRAGVPLVAGTTYHVIDPYTGSDNHLQQGKLNDNPNTWLWVGGTLGASKCDINNAMFHFTKDAFGNVWLVMAGDRASKNGDAYIDFEFLQQTLTANPDGTFTSAGPNGGERSMTSSFQSRLQAAATNPASRWSAGNPTERVVSNTSITHHLPVRLLPR